MQVDNNFNNYNRINFGARRIMSAGKCVDGLCEKVEVYKLDEYDIPFVQKLAIYMKNQKSKLNEAQKKLYYQLKEFVTHQDRYKVSGFFDDAKELYIGIKNDEQISGYMLLNNSIFRPYINRRKLTIDEICTNIKDKVTEDTFLYAFFGDKLRVNDFHSVWGTRFIKCKTFLHGGDSAKTHIRNCYPDYRFQVSTKGDYSDLEDVLGIAE